jgi:uncharacterized protein YecT (DUF1311 family)
MTYRACALAALMALAGPVWAQELPDPPFDIAPTESCAAESVGDTDPRDCIGLAAMACAEPYGFSTPIEGFCNVEEFTYWETRLDAAWETLAASNAAEDAAAPEGMPRLLPALESMRVTFGAHRDAECNYVMAQYRGGTGQGPALAYCLMYKTGEMALNLEGWLSSALPE